MADMTFETYLRQQAEKSQYGVTVIQTQIALDIADWIEKNRQRTEVIKCKDCKYVSVEPCKDYEDVYVCNRNYWTRGGLVGYACEVCDKAAFFEKSERDARRKWNTYAERNKK